MAYLGKKIACRVHDFQPDWIARLNLNLPASNREHSQLKNQEMDRILRRFAHPYMATARLASNNARRPSPLDLFNQNRDSPRTVLNLDNFAWIFMYLPGFNSSLWLIEWPDQHLKQNTIDQGTECTHCAQCLHSVR